MVMRLRARKEEDKIARREAILAVAGRSLGRRQYARVTMAEIAERCGLAKGTLYLYFSTKEELFLAALEIEVAAWFDAISEELIMRGRIDPRSFAEVVHRTLVNRGTLTDLLPLLHTVLEQNIDSETALRFKRMLRDKLVAGAAVVERSLPLRPGDGVRLLLRTHAMVVGLRQMADPPPAIAEVLARPELHPLQIDFEQELLESLTALVRGMLKADE
jgi:AcrR family transcriptional regulator